LKVEGVLDQAPDEVLDVLLDQVLDEVLEALEVLEVLEVLERFEVLGSAAHTAGGGEGDPGKSSPGAD
jgi:hypothetical protein